MNTIKFDVEKRTYSDEYAYSAIVEIINTGKSSIYIKDVKFEIEDA